jgi:lipoprotein-anchoring transpeptidase ErfK/SrfK
MSTPGRQHLIVDIPSQTLRFQEGDRIISCWSISTSRYGPGTAEGSFKTPTGMFRICEKIGDGAPVWSIFKSRLPTGEIASPGGDDDLILTRILWLEGLDPENANTRDRYIYFHGTNQEDRIGYPASHGCIRLRNEEMIDLFDQVSVGTHVEIRS